MDLENEVNAKVDFLPITDDGILKFGLKNRAKTSIEIILGQSMMEH